MLRINQKRYLLDVLKVCRDLEFRVIPIQVAHPLIQVRIVTPDGPQIALEMLDITAIKSNDGRIKTNISFGQVVSEQEWAF